MADEDFMDRIAREVDEQYRLPNSPTIDELRSILASVIDDLKTSKIELQDLQRKFISPLPSELA